MKTQEKVLQNLRRQLVKTIEERKAGQKHFEDKPYMERHLPPYLAQDIQGLMQARKTGHLVDCLEDEVYGSINSALYGGEITDEQAYYLRWKYLDMLPPGIEEI